MRILGLLSTCSFVVTRQHLNTRSNCVCAGDANTMLLLHQSLHSILISSNKHNRIETLTQLAAQSQFAVDYFFR